jgi:hypothetical protein
VGNAAGNYCSAGACVQCTATSQCGSGQTCQSHVCVTTTPTTIGCQSDADCTGSTEIGPYCDTSNGLCSECDAANPCPSGSSCEVGVCVAGSPQDCGSTADCSGNIIRSTCDTNAGLCAECTGDSDCFSSDYCHFGTCTPAPVCSSSFDCFNYCDGSGQCIDCIFDSDCGRREICLNGFCESSSSPPTLGCAGFTSCLNNCFGSACTNCETAVGAQGLALYNSFIDCINVNCATPCGASGSTNACNTCQSAVQRSTGACYPRIIACSQDP